MRLRALFLLTVLPVVGACASLRYPDVPPDQPRAYIRVEAGRGFSDSSDTSFLEAFDNADCIRGEHSGELGGIMYKDKLPPPTAIFVTPYIYIRAETHRLTRSACFNMVAFRPVAGETYVIRQDYLSGLCSVSVRTESTGSEPPGFVPLSIPPMCESMLRGMYQPT
jgi:hypothetical protein